MYNEAQWVDELGPPLLKGSLATLTGSLAWVPLKYKIKKRIFRGYYIRRDDYFDTLKFQYEKGAILGRAMRNKLKILEKMLVVPGKTEVKTIKVLQDTVGEHLAEFRKEFGKEPETFEEFAEIRTWFSLIDYYEAHSSEKKKAKEAFNEKIPLEIALPNIWMSGLQGISFGSSFPKLTVRMFVYKWRGLKNGKDSIKRTEELLKSDIPGGSEMLIFWTDEGIYLQFLAYFTLEYYPELLDPLDLRKYLQE